MNQARTTIAFVGLTFLVVVLGAVAFVVFENHRPSADSEALYRNTKLGYSIQILTGWRLAEAYMRKWNDAQGTPDYSLENVDKVVVTQATEKEETDFLTHADSVVGNYDFAPGRTVFIFMLSKNLEETRAFYSATEKYYPVAIKDVSVAGRQAIYIQSERGLERGGPIESLALPCSNREGSPSRTIDLRMKSAAPSINGPLVEIATRVTC